MNKKMESVEVGGESKSRVGSGDESAIPRGVTVRSISPAFASLYFVDNFLFNFFTPGQLFWVTEKWAEVDDTRLPKARIGASISGSSVVSLFSFLFQPDCVYRPSPQEVGKVRSWLHTSSEAFTTRHHGRNKIHNRQVTGGERDRRGKWRVRTFRCRTW